MTTKPEVDSPVISYTVEPDGTATIDALSFSVNGTKYNIQPYPDDNGNEKLYLSEVDQGSRSSFDQDKSPEMNIRLAEVSEE